MNPTYVVWLLVAAVAAGGAAYAVTVLHDRRRSSHPEPPRVDESAAESAVVVESVAGNPATASEPASEPGSVGSAGRRGGRKLWLTVGLAMVVLVGVGSGFGVKKYVDHKHQVEHVAAVKAQKEREAKKRAAKLAAQRNACHASADPFMAKMEALTAKTEVGVTQAQLQEGLQDASVAHSSADFDGLDADCLLAISQAEDAYNLLVKTNTLWNDCLTDIDCDLKTKNPTITRNLTTAGTDVAAAKELLAAALKVG